MIVRTFTQEDVEVCEGTRKPLSLSNSNSVELSDNILSRDELNNDKTGET
jgi:hypothetical protein